MQVFSRHSPTTTSLIGIQSRISVHSSTSTPPVRVRKQKPRASPLYIAAGATGTTPLKQTGLPALYNSSIMLCLCLFQSSTLVLLLITGAARSRFSDSLFLQFQSLSLFIFALHLTLKAAFSNVLSKPYSLLFCVVQWKHGLVSVHLCVCAPVFVPLLLRKDTGSSCEKWHCSVSAPISWLYKYNGQIVMARQQMQTFRCG